jgi:hypothetical protein
MKRMLFVLGATIFPVMLAATVISFAQQPQSPEGGVVIQRMKVMQGPDGAPVPPPPGDFMFVTSEVNFSGKIVKGAPYSAQAVTESIQTLSDGNRIVNKTTSTVYRDGEGRTRREQTLKVLGASADNGEGVQTIFISDPVAGTSYALDSRSHIAHKSSPMIYERKVLPGAAGTPGIQVGPMSDGQHFEFRVETGSGVAGTASAPKASNLPPPPPAPEGAEGEKVIVSAVGTGGMSYFYSRKGGPKNEVTEKLGTQNIEGVEAEGTRTTVTIAAGEIGNERAIEIVSERWYSPELQVTVMTRHSDPRTGETTYRLTNINRAEPAKSLFEVPSDYTVKEGMPAPAVWSTAPAKVRKPSSPE